MARASCGCAEYIQSDRCLDAQRILLRAKCCEIAIAVVTQRTCPSQKVQVDICSRICGGRRRCQRLQQLIAAADACRAGFEATETKQQRCSDIELVQGGARPPKADR
eukprot:7349895-Alexandrium_andersonii.AAC.1